MKPEIVSLETKRNEVDLDEKIETYFYWLTNYGHEAASMWAQGNLMDSEISEFQSRLSGEFTKRGFR
jgi:hypothetical protein